MVVDRLRRRRDEESGFTLIELLVTVSLMSIGLVIVLGGIGMFLRSTTVHRGSADLDGAIRTYAERLVYQPGCPQYTATPPTGFQSSVQVKYWDGNASPASFTTACPSSDTGVQQLTITLTRTADNLQDQLVIVKRQP